MSQLSAQCIPQDEVFDSCCPICSALHVRAAEAFDGRSLMKCSKCHVAYLYPQPSASEVTTHFESDVTAEQERRQRFETNREPVLMRVANYIRSSKRGGEILDVGCATGYFLARFSGTDWHPWGVELSHDFAKQAAASGINVRCGDVFQAAFSRDSFDVITVLDAFYYFPQPRAALWELRRILKPDGMFLLELPFAGSRIWRANAKLGRLLSRPQGSLLKTSDHLFYYTPRAIHLLLQQCGFEVQALRLLPGNRQANRLRNGMYKCFYFCSFAVNAISGSRVLLGPRFFVAATKDASRQGMETK